MATYQGPLINNRPPQITDSAFYADIRYDADDSQPTYIGLNLVNGASTSGTDWKIYCFTYSGANTTRIRLAYGSWDLRVSLFP